MQRMHSIDCGKCVKNAFSFQIHFFLITAANRGQLKRSFVCSFVHSFRFIATIADAAVAATVGG